MVDTFQPHSLSCFRSRKRRHDNEMNLEKEKGPRVSQHHMGWNVQRTFPLLPVAGEISLDIPFYRCCLSSLILVTAAGRFSTPTKKSSGYSKATYSRPSVIRRPDCHLFVSAPSLRPMAGQCLTRTKIPFRRNPSGASKIQVFPLPSRRDLSKSSQTIIISTSADCRDDNVSERDA